MPSTNDAIRRCGFFTLTFLIFLLSFAALTNRIIHFLILSHSLSSRAEAGAEVDAFVVSPSVSQCVFFTSLQIFVAIILEIVEISF